MGPVEIFALSLSFHGETLDPDEITTALGARPTQARRRGEPRNGSPDAARWQDGFWSLSSACPPTEDADLHIADILDRLTSDLQTWHRLTTQFRARMFFGMNLPDGNRGFSVSAETLGQLAARGLRLDFDLHAER